MKLFSKLFKSKEKQKSPEQNNTIANDEKFIPIMKKKIETYLKIIETQIFSIQYKIVNFNLLSDKDAEILYEDLNGMIQNVKTYLSFAEKYNFEDCQQKSKEILENLESLKDSFNRSLTGIVY